ncbi:transcription-repair coupling factor [Endothiovibrio diazotrophicus]
MTTDYRNPFHPSLPNTAGTLKRWGRLYGSSPGLVLAEAARAHGGPLVAVTADMAQAYRLESELRFYLGERLPVLIFPDWETLPYDHFSPHQDIISQRLAALYRLPSLERGILIVPVATLMQRVAPRSFLEAHSLLLDRGDRIDLDEMRARLERAGYQCVSQVVEHGEFAVRGSLLDLYPMGSPLPFRVDLFDEEVESIRTFDPENQRTLEAVDSIRLLPAREFPLDEAGTTRFRTAYRTAFEGDPKRSPIYREVSEARAPAGIEYYLPLFFETTDTLYDYLPRNALVARSEQVIRAAEEFLKQVESRFEQHRYDLERPLLEPAKLYLGADELVERWNGFPAVEWQGPEIERDGENYATRAPTELTLQARATRPAGALLDFIEGFAGRVLFAAESAGRREALLELLGSNGLKPTAVEDWAAFAAGQARLAITIAPLERGLVTEELAVIAESQLFGERAMQRRRRKARGRDGEAVVRDLTELAVGAPVVHEDHGVGRYLGLQTIDAGGMVNEYLTLEYAGSDKLYVPVSSLHLISRYTGADPEQAPLHKLGTEQWAKAKKKAAERIRDVAAELLDLYARRAARVGTSMEPAADELAQFAAAFPFEETEDQGSAIEAVLADLAAPKPMDRVVCGDVGFGKTEVAMRAAFAAANSGKQVAMLVPTTLLANQHFQNFSDRFADWPIRIESLSRFGGKKSQDKAIAGLADGTVDVVIGTHKLLSKEVKFKNLGLVIIDEEHRFGVRQKEELKKLRAEVDILTLTATPIPRTLNMAMAGMRDLSIIATPPAKRLAVKTFIGEWNRALINEACLREIKRGGQVYFVHNKVEDIEKVARELGEIVPDASIRIAHGQMREQELERVMLDFYHQRFNILVATTIIESGIDVPTANTIIINRADRFGLAQLHQMRGRVGRSHHRAYAYLVVPDKRSITADAAKRLEAIESLEDLGAGFMLASHDLEIRGAGELLGDEQSGQIHEIGFSLYTELLERAVKALKSGRTPELEKPLHHGTEIDLGIPALIPDDYLPDVHTRLILYKRIANAESLEALKELQVEMIDRFGLLPEQTKNLFAVTELKLKATPMGITKIDAGPQGGRLLFEAEPAIDPAKLIRLIQSQPAQYKLDGQEKLRFFGPMEGREDRLRAIDWLLDTIAAS